MKKTIMVPVVILRTKTGYNAFSPAVDGCVVTDNTMDKILIRMKDALEFHFEGDQLVKQPKYRSAEGALRKSFDDYGTDAFYASLKIAA